MADTELHPTPSLDVEGLRADFPILARPVHGKRLVYLDNAATTQKPVQVLEAIDRYYRESNANIHRSAHWLAEQATRLYEDARIDVARFLNAREAAEIVFTRGCTESINLVAHGFASERLGPGDEIVVSWLEHHSNIVPWQLACQRSGATLRVVPIDDRGDIVLEELAAAIGERTRLVAISAMSNALGTITPLDEVIRLAHARDVPVLVDAAQAAPHLPLDVQALDCDFLAFSAHKMYGPTGIGALYAKRSLLEALPPYQGGGEMIASVTFERTTYAEIPHRFEAGTPNIAGVVGFGAAVRYLSAIDRDALAAHEDALVAYATERLDAIPGLRIVGRARRKAAVVSFVSELAHPHDIGTILDRDGVAIRTGHHCAQPIMDRYGIPATARASFGLYNGRDDVDALADGLAGVARIFG